MLADIIFLPPDQNRLPGIPSLFLGTVAAAKSKSLDSLLAASEPIVSKRANWNYIRLGGLGTSARLIPAPHLFGGPPKYPVTLPEYVHRNMFRRRVGELQSQGDGPIIARGKAIRA